MAVTRSPILVYTNAGADPFCADALLRACRETHGVAEPIDASTLLGGGWQSHCAAIAFPGGADRPYAEKLDGRGNAILRAYVEAGGRFLGVCAGAYYACRRIDFTGDDFAVKADRELALFPGTAVGSLPELAAPYRVRDLTCASAVEVDTPIGPASALYWGGCRFDADAGATPFEVLARYAALPADRNLAAVRMTIGRGVAVLVGVHAEVAADDFDAHRTEYPAPQDAARLDAHVARLRAADPARRRLFAFLIDRLLAND